jgi:hypothetical protein
VCQYRNVLKTFLKRDIDTRYKPLLPFHFQTVFFHNKADNKQSTLQIDQTVTTLNIITMASSHNNGHIAEESPQVYRNDWRTSDAKKTLRAMVADGRVTEATNADTVYDETDPAFKFYDRKKFKTNLRNLLKSVNKAASQTTPNHKKTGQADNKTKEPVYLQDWRYSKAKQVLKRLIEDGTVSAAMPAIDVYNKYPVLFARYKKENFEKITRSFWNLSQLMSMLSSLMKTP